MNNDFLQLINLLSDTARKAGDAAFADALSDCVINATGGNPDCPMGRSIFEKFMESGEMPDGDSPLEAARPQRKTPQKKSVKRSALMRRLHKAVKQEARLRNDQRFIQALESCQRHMLEDPNCPLHRVFKHTESK